MTINKKFVIIISAVVSAVILAGWLFFRFSQGAPRSAEDTKAGGLTAQRRQELESLSKNLTVLRLADKDLDGLSDEEESRLGTNPEKADTDGDGLLDRDEVKIYQSDPLKVDTDGDGFTDGDEVRKEFSPTGPGKLK